jgi:hypothetical protein
MPNVLHSKEMAQALIEKALDEALAELAHHAQATRDCYIMGDADGGRQAFHQTISALAKATHQISLLNLK